MCSLCRTPYPTESSEKIALGLSRFRFSFSVSSCCTYNFVFTAHGERVVLVDLLKSTFKVPFFYKICPLFNIIKPKFTN